MTPTSAPPFRLDEHVGYLLRRAYVRAERVAARVIPAPFDARELTALEVLGSVGPRSQQELAALLCVNRTLMVKLIDGLEARDLVRRERDPADSRSYALVPTRRGKAERRRMAPRIEELEEIFTANLTAAGRRRLTELLTKLLTGSEALTVGAAPDRCSFLVTHAHFTVRALGRERLGRLDLNPRRLGALATVGEHEPCSQQVVAERLAVSAPVVVEVVGELVGAGLLNRERDAADRRRYDLRLTAAGRARLSAGADEIAAIEDGLRDRLGRAGLTEMQRLLAILIAPATAGRPASPGGHEDDAGGGPDDA